MFYSCTFGTKFHLELPLPYLDSWLDHYPPTLAMASSAAIPSEFLTVFGDLLVAVYEIRRLPAVLEFAKSNRFAAANAAFLRRCSMIEEQLSKKWLNIEVGMRSSWISPIKVCSAVQPRLGYSSTLFLDEGSQNPMTTNLLPFNLGHVFQRYL